MTHILIVSHGTLAESFKETIAMIAGPTTAESIKCLCMTPEKDPDEFAAEAKALLNQAPEDDYLIFADLFAASPCNTCVSVFRSSSYRMVTGMNLGAIMETVMSKDSLSLEELYIQALETAKDCVRGVALHI